MAPSDPRFLELSRVFPGHREGKTGRLEECRAEDLTELFPENTRSQKYRCIGASGLGDLASPGTFPLPSMDFLPTTLKTS